MTVAKFGGVSTKTKDILLSAYPNDILKIAPQ